MILSVAAVQRTSRHTCALIAVVSLFLGGAVALRLVLLPVTEGWDFHAYERLAWLTLHGRDVYGMKRIDLPLAWTYFPLGLDMFSGLEWMALHTGWPFRVLGKLPTVAADLGVGWLLFTALRRRGHNEWVAVTGMASYLFNPLVLYNGTFLGRFDALALFFLLYGLEHYRTRLFAPAYALAIAVKTFPLFLLPVLALGRDRQDPRRLLVACVLVPLLALPTIVTDPHGLVAYLFYDARATWFGRLSWYVLLEHSQWVSQAHVLTIARAGMVVFALSLLVVVQQPLYTKVAACFALFITLNRAVWEQYLLWALPFLIIVWLHERSRLALWLALVCTCAGMLENEQTWTPYDRQLSYALLPTPSGWLNGVLALSAVVFVSAQVWTGRTRRRSMLGEDT